MKASVNHKTPQKPTFTPKPLSIEQRNAIDLLILGKTDQETADTVGVSRETVWGWHHEHPVFMATLEECRLQVWRGPQERLRSLAMKAVENLAEKVEAGDIRCSLEVLKAMGLYGCVSHIGQTDPEKILKAQAEAQVQREGIPEDATDAMLINLTKNAAYTRRLGRDRRRAVGRVWRGMNLRSLQRRYARGSILRSLLTLRGLCLKRSSCPKRG